MESRRTINFKTEEEARKDALRENKLEERLNNLYDLVERFPEELGYETEIEELEQELGH